MLGHSRSTAIKKKDAIYLNFIYHHFVGKFTLLLSEVLINKWLNKIRMRSLPLCEGLKRTPQEWNRNETLKGCLWKTKNEQKNKNRRLGCFFLPLHMQQ